MRELTDAQRVHRFMRVLGDEARHPAHVYFTGGATAVLYGWRATTIDIDLKLVPDSDELLRAIPAIKERLQINVELASPADFIPVSPAWAEHSPFVAQEGPLTFHHFDLCAQALAKVERGHARDLDDVHELIRRRLVTGAQLRAYFAAIESELYRFPALNPASFRRALDMLLASLDEGS